jgi:two-component system, OmpR family, response regulator ResD
MGSGAGERVLVVEDDPILGEVVDRYLRRAGFEVRSCADGADAVQISSSWRPDLVVLDLMLPGIHGLEVCERLRGERRVPIIMCTALGEEEHRVAGLEAGADDYVTKPFSPRELVLRVAAVLRRASPNTPPVGDAVLRAGRLALDLAARELTVSDRPVRLTSREFELLAHMMANPRRAFGRDELMEAVWGWTYGDSSTVTVHVRRLRLKVEPDPGEPCHLVTVAGGYRFDP